jgi:hypothetical protein
VAAVYFPDTFYGDGSRVALPVPESEQGGSDLNGDGDSDDRVIHLWSASRGLENTAAAMCPDSAPIVLYPGGFAFAVGEEQSNCVMAVYEPGTGVKSLDLQVSFELWERVATGAGGFAFLALESANSIETDLNGDGDYGDEVVHFYRTGSGVENLGLAASWVSPGGGSVAFGVSEFRQAGTDLNGDGDDSDVVVHLYDPVGGVTNLGVSSFFGGVAAMTDGYGIQTFEESQGDTDLNGDGDTRDWGCTCTTPFRVSRTSDWPSTRSGAAGCGCIQVLLGWLQRYLRRRMETPISMGMAILET